MKQGNPIGKPDGRTVDLDDAQNSCRRQLELLAFVASGSEGLGFELKGLGLVLGLRVWDLVRVSLYTEVNLLYPRSRITGA